VNKESYFYVHDGPVIKDRKDLLEFLRIIPQETFSYHVNSEKNDFANWIRGVFNDEALAKKLGEAKTPEDMQTALEDAMRKRANNKKDKKSVIARLVEVIKHG
jgi:hypothetical protein